MKRRCEESIGAFDFGAFVGDLSVPMVDGWVEIAAKILKMVPLVIGSFVSGTYKLIYFLLGTYKILAMKFRNLII